MPTVNLLPWRAQKREAAQKHFTMLALTSAVMAAGVGYLVSSYFDGQLETQISRNDFLRQETESLRIALQEIDQLDKVRDELQTRIDLVYTLSGERIKPIKLIDEIARGLPKGVYLSEINNKGAEMTLSGVTNSHRLVSTFVSDIEKSLWVTSTRINEVTSESSGQSWNQQSGEDNTRGLSQPSTFSVTLFTEFPASLRTVTDDSPQTQAAMRAGQSPEMQNLPPELQGMGDSAAPAANNGLPAYRESSAVNNAERITKRVEAADEAYIKSQNSLSFGSSEANGGGQ